MIMVCDLLEALDAQLGTIRSRLGPDWPLFRQELAPVLAAHTDVTDRRVLPVAGELVWQVCCRHPPAAEKLDTHIKRHFRRPKEPNADDTVPILEIANSFQSLLIRLMEVEPAEESAKQRDGNRADRTGR